MRTIRFAAFAAFVYCAPVFAQPFSCTTVSGDIPRAHYTGWVASMIARDFDADGHADVLAGNVASIFYGRGDGSFETPVGEKVRAVFAADLNGDGLEDLFAPSSTGAGTFVLVNRGNRAWAPPRRIYGEDAAVLAVVDFTHDGHLDVVLRTDLWIVLLVNKGDDTFRPERYPISPYSSVALGDLDADGHLDLVEAAGLSVLLHRGNGTATFAPGIEILDSTFSSPYLIDVTGDGVLDLLVNAGGVVSVYRGPITGPAGAALTQFSTLQYWQVSAGDYNGDGAIDLAIGVRGSESALQVMLNDGNGVFAPARARVPQARAFASADFNHDGSLDLAFAVGGYTAFAMGRGDGTFVPLAPATPVGSIVSGTVDLDRDATDELVLYDGSRLHHGREQPGTLGYSFEELPFDVALASAARMKRLGLHNTGLVGDGAVAAADVHASPGRELLVASGTRVRTFSRIGTGSWRERASYPFEATVEALSTANFNELDAQDEIAVVAGISLQVRRASGETLFSYELDSVGDPLESCGRYFGLHASDVDGDRHADLILTDAGAFVCHTHPVQEGGPRPIGRMMLFRGRGDGTFEPARPLLSNMHIADVSHGDFNGDGYTDLVLTELYQVGGGAVLVSFGNASGGFETPRRFAGLSQPGWATAAHAAADVNADGFDDLILQADGILSYFYGTAGGLALHGRYAGADVPYVARRSGARFPRVVYSQLPGELVVIETACPPVKRRGVRH